MEYIAEQPAGQYFILCCECGTQIEPNPTNMCVGCLRTQVDITEGIPKQGTVYFCRNCERYQQPPSQWIKATLESRELLSLCLKKIKGLKTVRLVDAGFVWTEPHSKRIKVKLTIEKEVVNGAVLQQTFIVEFVVHNQMCDDCHRVEAKDYWRAVVQVRQKTSHKKTLFYLEQQILKHKAHSATTGIQQESEGLDFFFASKQEGKKLVDFLQAVVPCKYLTAQELVSHDQKSNIYNYKSTFSVEIVPICKDNIVCLPPKLAQTLGNLSQICIVHRVTQTIHIIDPSTCQIAEVPGMLFWRNPFSSLCAPKQLVEFIVMETEVIHEQNKRHIAGSGQHSTRHTLADVWVVRASELGTSDAQYHTRTHLGHLLNYGDSVLGFDLRAANVNDTNLDKMKAENVPDVILVRKVYGDRHRRQKKRKWRLQRLDLALETTSQDGDFNDFLEDLEEDVEFRQNVNIYKNPAKINVEPEDTDDEDIPRISLAEMLDDLHITQAAPVQDATHDATGGDGEDMME